jgi:hypothetical protein
MKSLDKMTLDKMTLDEMALDEMIYRLHFNCPSIGNNCLNERAF